MEQAEKATQKKTRTATHTQLAREYAMRHYNNLIHTRGRWHSYSEGVWEPIPDFEVGLEIVQMLEKHESTSSMRPTDSMRRSVDNLAKLRLAVREEQIDAAENLINLQNGVYDLKTQKLFPHDPDYYQTTQLPFAHDPNAQAITWQMYLMSTFVKPKSVDFDQELTEFVQEAVGYSLTTSVCHHSTFWCYGEGANGKGVLFHVLEQLGGTACVPLNVGLLSREQYQLADLAGKRIALCSEAASTKNLVEDAYIKALVGGDSMNVRQIRKEPFVLTPTVHLWWSMNELPAVADTSEGFWRRVKVVPFNRQFDEGERILDLKERLEAELPGIFNWAMDGLRRLRDRGRFVEPEQIREATKLYRKESNPVELFVEDRCFTHAPIDQQAFSSALYSEYSTWCKDNGFKPHSSKNFRHELERLGHYAVRRGGGIQYGLGLKL